MRVAPGSLPGRMIHSSGRPIRAARAAAVHARGMADQDWRALVASAAVQHQVVNLAQADRAGFSRWAARRLVAAGVGDRPQRGVLGLGGERSDPQRRAKAAELAVGEPVRVTGVMALHLWGFAPPPDLVDLVVPRGRGTPDRPGITGHRLRAWHPDDQAERHGITVTALPLTLLFLARDRSVSQVRALIMDGVQRRHCTTAGVEACAGRHANVAGSRLLRGLAWELDATRADSVLEHETRRRLHDDGLDPDPGQLEVSVPDGRTLHLDVPFTAQSVGLECDGMTHATRHGLTLDALRHNAYQETDWTVLRVTWDVLDRHWIEFVDCLRRLLERGRT